VHDAALSTWESFYVIVGSSGGALIGLQFVVITLIADRQRLATLDSVSAFGTPTVVHFTGALLVSAIMSAPWPSLGPASIALTVCGAAGLVYTGMVIRQARRQTTYEPVWEDWLWFIALPCASYSALAIAAALLRTHPQGALFVVGGSALSLLLIGIHNAWDSITHIVVSTPRSEDAGRD
jgi:hypothetical protein